MVARSVGTRHRKTSCHACGVSSFRSLPIPELTHKDAAIQATRELTHALQQPHFHGPLAQFHDDHLTSLCELSKIFHTIALGVENIALGVDTTINKHLPPVPPPTPAPPPDTPTTPTSLQPLTKLPYNLRPRTSRPHYTVPITHSETGKSVEYRDLINNPSTRACRILGLTALNSLLQYVNWLVWEVCSVN